MGRIEAALRSRPGLLWVIFILLKMFLWPQRSILGHSVLQVGKTVHNIGGLACILGLTISTINLIDVAVGTD